MNVNAEKARLVAITKELSLHWAETRNYWRDARSQEFEKRYLVELGAHVDRVATVVEKLDALLAKVRSDCE